MALYYYAIRTTPLQQPSLYLLQVNVTVTSHSVSTVKEINVYITPINDDMLQGQNNFNTHYINITSFVSVYA